MIPKAQATKRKQKTKQNKKNPEIKNSFDGFISRLYMAELEDISIESSKTARKRIKTEKNKTRISKGCGKATEGITYRQWEYQK